jgi:tRNA pseudouridine55 synthase
LDGILNVLKPPGMTSHDIVAYIRKITGIKKVGHTGTLDPGAAGVLPICIGKATKAAEYITGGAKKYRAEVKLGIITDTADSFGRVIEQNDWTENISIDNFLFEIDKAIKSFQGKSEQIPPMYSAIKINGQKLYELARKGVEIERASRQIEIFGISIIDYSKYNGTILFDVACSKGTYIRVICEDIGKKLGCGAHMSFLLRTEVSGYKIEDSYTLEELTMLANQKKIPEILNKIETVFLSFPRICISDTEVMKKLHNGMEIVLEEKDCNQTSNEMFTIYFNETFVALAHVRTVNGKNYVKFEKYFG